MIYLIISLVLGIIILIMAILALYHRNIKVAILAAGVVSLFASILYLLMDAPDVALTEAAIGSGLSTIIFFYVLNKIQRNHAEK